MKVKSNKLDVVHLLIDNSWKVMLNVKRILQKKAYDSK